MTFTHCTCRKLCKPSQLKYLVFIACYSCHNSPAMSNNMSASSISKASCTLLKVFCWLYMDEASNIKVSYTHWIINISLRGTCSVGEDHAMNYYDYRAGHSQSLTGLSTSAHTSSEPRYLPPLWNYYLTIVVVVAREETETCPHQPSKVLPSVECHTMFENEQNQTKWYYYFYYYCIHIQGEHIRYT